MPTRISPPDEVIAALYAEGLSIIQIGRQFGVSDETIRGHLKRLKIPRRGARKHVCDNTSFLSIDSPTAYWLGFIYADGNVYKDTLSVKLGAEDLCVLEGLKEFLKYTGPVETELKYPRLRVYSPALCNNLVKWGVVPNKTHTLSYPDVGVYDRDFIRGFFDGDGWRASCWRGYQQLSMSSCSLPFLEAIKQKIAVGIGRDGGCILKIHKDRKIPTYSLRYGGNKIVRAIDDYLWSEIGSQRLERKAPHWRSK